VQRYLTDVSFWYYEIMMLSSGVTRMVECGRTLVFVLRTGKWDPRVLGQEFLGRELTGLGTL
jgi:hypothetical protein